MHRLRAVILFLLCGCVLSRAQPLPAPSQWVLNSPTGFEYEFATGLAVFTNTLYIKLGDSVMTADRGTVNQQTGDAAVEGNVRLDRAGQIILAERLQYNFLTGRVLGRDFRAHQGPFYVKSDAISGDAKERVYVGVENIVTPDDYSKPAYSIRTETLIIVPGEYLEARHATLRLGDVPVFYFPRYRRSLAAAAPRLEATPGYRSRFGPYLLLSYNWEWNQYLDGRMHLDGRERRGLGLGPDLNWHLKRWGEGSLETYFARDLEPGTDLLDRPIDEERYRVNVAHQMKPLTNLYLKGILRYQSDPLVVRDFFESEYKDNIQPSTFVEANQFWKNYSLNVFAQPRIHDFFETVERLPDIRLTGFRQQIGATPLFYESESSFGYLRRKFAEGDTNNQPFSAIRGDTLQQILWPQTYFGWLHITPRVGARFTHYGEAQGPGGETEEENRGVFNTGAEASFKASHLWRNISSDFWDLNGLRHIIRPSVNYAFVPHPTVSPHELPQFDYAIPTSRLAPIDFPDFNAIDAIDSQNVIRFGLQNKLQTKRRRQIDNIVDWELFTDWRITRRTGQTSLSDLFSELDLRPFTWLTLSSEIRYGLSEAGLRESYHRLALTPNTVWSMAVGHRFRRDDPQFGEDSGHNLIATTLYYRLNENWGLRLGHNFEARDGTLEEQYYTIYRDFRSWTGAFTVRVRDNREGPTDLTVAFTFNLKAFPRYELRDDVIHPSKLVGR